MSSSSLISWLFWIVLAALAFAAVWFGLPWVLNLIFKIAWPDVVIGLLSLVAFLAVLGWRYRYWRPTQA